MRHLEQIIIHCSDSDLPQHDDIDVIRKWHTEERGFWDVGYHFFIKKNGTVQKGRDVESVGAHCRGQNSDSIGICLSGRHGFAHIQFLALHQLVVKLLGNHKTISTIHGHRFYNPAKTCPNFDVEEWVKTELPNFIENQTKIEMPKLY